MTQPDGEALELSEEDEKRLLEIANKIGSVLRESRERHKKLHGEIPSHRKSE